jgi:hypothetical protein
MVDPEQNKRKRKQGGTLSTGSAIGVSVVENNQHARVRVLP